MSKLLHNLSQLIQRQITERGLVLWYDPEKAYTHAVDRLALDNVELLKFEDGYFRLREALEPWLEWIDEAGQPMPDKEVPPRLLVYIPRSRDESQHTLVEAETAGVVIEPGASVADRNTRLAGLVERVYAKVSPEKAGHVARQVEEGLLGFEDVEQMAEEAGSTATGALKLIFGQASPVEVILLFASSDAKDGQISKKKALTELAALIEDEVGLSTANIASAAELRKALIRHLLLGELSLALPTAQRTGPLEAAAPPEKPVQRETISHLCHTWRNRIDLLDAYADAAESLELELELTSLDLPAPLIGELETFPFLERLLLASTGAELLEEKATVAGALAVQRRQTFWNRRLPETLLQWSLIETAADLLEDAKGISAAIKKRKWTLDELVAAYVGHAKPWMALDTKARHLETRYARFDFDWEGSGPDWEKIMAKCRTSYLAALDLMTEAYTHGLQAAGFQTGGAIPQSTVFRDEVSPYLAGKGKTAYLLVDALRYEMAVELVDGLGSEFAVAIKPALGQLPGITPLGMATLMPGAENGITLERHAGKLSVVAGTKSITDRASRMAWLQSQTGDGTVVMKLGEVVRLTPKKKQTLFAAKLLVVTSQEIDRIGEGESEDDEARIYMEDVLEKLRRGIRNLASIGFGNIIVSADHGFIFAEGFEDGLKMDPPGGDTVELHPRCWIGKGGQTADGYFRVPASALELGGEMECAFPRGLGTFKVKGGAGAYFHGGASLQEQVIPVVSLSHKTSPATKGAAAKLTVAFTKKAITNRFFSITLSLEAEEMFTPEPKLVRIELLAGRDLAGHPAMAAYGFEEGTREVAVRCGETNSVTMMLSADPVPEKVSLRVIDSNSESPLATLKDIPVNLAL
jgi:hypothetical protein